MSMRKVSFVPEEFYHLYNRGNSRQAIFLNDADYARFSALLYLANGTNSFEFRELASDALFDFNRSSGGPASGNTASGKNNSEGRAFGRSPGLCE